MTRDELSRHMFTLVEQWKNSGKTQVDFCNENNLALVKLRYWIRKYDNQNNNSFIKINPERHSSTSLQSIEIIFPNGVKAIIHQTESTLVLRKIISCW
jgi:hypothetical protein